MDETGTSENHSWEMYSALSSNRNDTDLRRTFPPRPYTPLGMTLISVPVVVIIIIIVLGNSLVVLAVLSQERLKRRTQNWLIVSLAIADLLVGLLVMPFTLTYELLGVWTFGGTFCEIWLALDVLFVTASILNLCVISIDRYWSLTKVVHYSSTISTPQARIRISTMIAGSWLLAFVICLPPLVGWRPIAQDETIGRRCNLSSEIGYVLYSALGSFFLPLSIVLFIYAKIFVLTKRRIADQRRKAKDRENLLLPNITVLVNKENDMVNCDQSIRLLPVNGDQKPDKHSIRKCRLDSEGNCESSADALDEKVIKGITTRSRASVCAPSLFVKPLELRMRILQQRKAVRRRERQATVVLGAILGAFVLSWMPFFCSYVLSAVCCETPEVIFDVIFWLGYCNSGLNPFIYNYFNPEFRRAFRHIFYRMVGYASTNE